jgi:hypothetical protein
MMAYCHCRIWHTGRIQIIQDQSEAARVQTTELINKPRLQANGLHNQILDGPRPR